MLQENEILLVSVIGLGKQNLSDHLPNLLKNPKVKIDSVCDLNEEVSLKIGKELNVPNYTSVDDLLKERKPDLAIVALPHYEYLDVIKKLAKNKIHIFKEKPFAVNLQEAMMIHNELYQNDIKMMVAVQRKFNSIFKRFEEYKNQIGRVYSIHGHYTMNFQKLDGSWRSKKELSGGGALLDMGYHIIDLLIWYFGLPDSISCKLGFSNLENQDYDVDDTAKILFEYKNEKNNIVGSLFVSTIFPTKEEKLTIYGTNGTIEIKNNEISLLNLENNLVEKSFLSDKNRALYDQLDHFINWILNDNDKTYSYLDHFKHVAFIDSCYKSHFENSIIIPNNLLLCSQIV